MAGYLEILIWMLCAYFVLKGVEILQLALTCRREERRAPMRVGVASLVASVILAAGFFAFTTYYSHEFNKRFEASQPQPKPFTPDPNGKIIKRY